MNQYLFHNEKGQTIETAPSFKYAQKKALKKIDLKLKTHVNIITEIRPYKNGYIFIDILGNYLVKIPSDYTPIKYCKSIVNGKLIIDTYLCSIGKR